MVSTSTLQVARPARGRVRRCLMAALVAGTLASSRIAAAEVSIVMDPSPPFSGTLMIGDFSESAPGDNETFKFNGEARNTTANAMRLIVSARENGAIADGSQQTFTLAANATTSISYVFRDLGPSPSTVGLDFDAPDGTVSFVAGTFDAAPAPPPAPAPAMGSRGLAGLATLLLFSGVIAMRARARRPASVP
jgi:hypothetical protein